MIVHKNLNIMNNLLIYNSSISIQYNLVDFFHHFLNPNKLPKDLADFNFFVNYD